MKKGFSLVEIIISISLVSVVSLFVLVIIKRSEPTYADPYENVRLIISDSVNLFLNTNQGLSYKDELYDKKQVLINSNVLIKEGYLEEEYFVENINDYKNIENLEITVTLDEEGFLNYSVNIQ